MSLYLKRGYSIVPNVSYVPNNYMDPGALILLEEIASLAIIIPTANSIVSTGRSSPRFAPIIRTQGTISVREIFKLLAGSDHDA